MLIRVPVDTRDLNYGIYFDEGDPQRRPLTSYDSHTTMQLGVEGVERLLLTLPEIHAELRTAGRLAADVA